jgi:hypothetical protein
MDLQRFVFAQATQGMNIKDECKSWFTEMKWKKVHRFVVYKIDEKTRAVLVDKVGGPGEGYEQLVAALPKDDCRYAVFDFDFVSVDNCQKSKIFFIAWYNSFSFHLPRPGPLNRNQLPRSWLISNPLEQRKLITRRIDSSLRILCWLPTVYQ